MNISGLDKAAVLVALYNASQQQGMGFLNPRGRDDLSIDEARELLKVTQYFDYLAGRVMKVDLRNTEVSTLAYNRDNGEGAAERAVDAIRVSENAA